MAQLIEVPGAGILEFPDGMTDDEMAAAIQANFPDLNQSAAPQPQAEQPTLSAPTEEQKRQTSLPMRIVKGMRDPLDAGAQLLANALPDEWVQAGNKFNNWLADTTGLVGKLPEGGVDQQVREAEQAYQAARQAQGETGIDWARIGGNVLSPVNLAIASRIPAAATLGGRVGVGMGAGAGFGALSPVGSGDFWEEKLKQTGAGAVAGGVVPLAAGGLARVISPRASTNPNLALLEKEGVNTTIGQKLGGRWNSLEEKMMSLPILGDAIANARTRSIEDFNRAAINRAAGKAGAQVDDIGQAGVREAGDALSKAYDDVLNQIKGVKFDAQFQQELAQLRQMSNGLVPGMRAKFNKTLDDVLQGRRSPNGSMLATTYKKADSELGNLAKRYGKSSVASEQELGDAFTQLQALLRDQLARSNPQHAERLAQINAGWANLVRVEGAAKAAKNAEGVFTPAQLNTAIQTADKSVRGRSVARGTALMQDLGSAGQSVIGNKTPNSFTTDRALIAGGTLGSYFINPAIPAGLLGGAALYTKPMQSLLGAALTARPQSAGLLADAVRKSGPSLIPGASYLGLEAMGQ